MINFLLISRTYCTLRDDGFVMTKPGLAKFSAESLICSEENYHIVSLCQKVGCAKMKMVGNQFVKPRKVGDMWFLSFGIP